MNDTSNQREVEKEYLEGYIEGRLRFQQAWRGVEAVDVVVHPAPGKTPNWTCEVSPVPAEGSAQAEALKQVLADAQNTFRLREWV
jgi:hypothetical protein